MPGIVEVYEGSKSMGEAVRDYEVELRARTVSACCTVKPPGLSGRLYVGQVGRKLGSVETEGKG